MRLSLLHFKSVPILSSPNTSLVKSIRMATQSNTSRYRVLVTDGGVPKSSVEFLKAKNCLVDQWHLESVMPRQELIKRINDADAVFCTINDKLDREVIQAASEKLKVVATMSVGTDHIDKKALKERGIRFGYTPDVLTTACAEYIICLTLATMRKVVEGAQAVRNGQWPDGWRPLWMCGATIADSTVGFVGLGRIGQAVAHRLKPFQPVKMLYNCRSRKSELEGELGVAWCNTLDELMKSADVVIVCCALDESTRHIMSKQKMGLMRRGSYFINASRGPVVDQGALVELLEEGHFGGVGLDVTTPEPLPASHPLLTFPECTVMPHIASSDVKTREKMADLVVKNIMAALDGGEMPAEWTL